MSGSKESPSVVYTIYENGLMMRTCLKTIVLVLAAGLVVCGAFSQAQMANPKPGATPKQAATAQATAAQKDVPAEYKAGIAQLQSAKSDLEKAGDKWGGYRVKGIHSIDEALNALGQPPVASRNEMQSGNVDEPAMMNSGISKLQTAKADFEKAGNDWGGRKAKAVSLVDQALNELQQGIAYAKSHHTY